MPGLKAAQARKEAFSTDLAGHIEACEKNYYRLVGMLPGLRDGTERWYFQAGDNAKIRVVITLISSAPYTSELEVSQKQDGLALPDLKLRLYHDASVAEVIAFDGHRNWKSKYEYPNPQMYQPDEKLALNRFLEDWLVFCRKHGLVAQDICESVLDTQKSDIHK